jgi:O-antigen ligase
MIVKITASLYIFSTILFAHYKWGTKYNKIMAVSFFAVVIVERLYNNKKLLEISPQHILFILWCMLTTFSGIISGSGEQVFNYSIRTISIFLASIPFFMLLVDRRCFTWMSWTFVLSAILSHATISFGILPQLVVGRAAGTLGNPNTFAFVCLIGLVNLTYLWKVYPKRIVKVIILLAGALLSYQIILAGSRKGIIGVFLILFLQYVFFVFQSRKKGSFKRLVGGLILLFVFLSGYVYFINASEYGHRFRNAILYLKGEELERRDSSLVGRHFLIKFGIENFTKNPFIGTGFSSFKDMQVGPEIGLYSRRVGLYSHSNFIEILISSGIFGFILYYAIYLSCILQLRRKFKSEIDENHKPILYFAITSIAVLFSYEFFAVSYYSNEFWNFFSIVFASLTILNQSAQKKQSDH